MNIDLDYASFYVMLAAYLGFFVWYGFVLYSNRKEIHCKDLITNRAGKPSRTALFNLSGLIIASWTPIHMAITANTPNEINSAIFYGCLMYLAGVELFSKWLAHKEGQSNGTAKREIGTVNGQAAGSGS